jgi:hypothetical protein
MEMEGAKIKKHIQAQRAALLLKLRSRNPPWDVKLTAFFIHFIYIIAAQLFLEVINKNNIHILIQNVVARMRKFMMLQIDHNRKRANSEQGIGGKTRNCFVVRNTGSKLLLNCYMDPDHVFYLCAKYAIFFLLVAPFNCIGQMKLCNTSKKMPLSVMKDMEIFYL